MARRTERGERLITEWGDERPEGWYEPPFTVTSGGASDSDLDARWALVAAMPKEDPS